MSAGIVVQIVESRLTDGSKVYAVHISMDGGEPLKLDAVTEKDAYALATRMDEAIADHTNEQVLLPQVPAMNDNAYAIHEANQAADAAAEARAEGATERADDDYLGAPDRSPRLQLLEARYMRAIDEAEDLHEALQGWSWYVAHVDDRAELWMRALESALAECRTALKYVRETTARRA